jgi:Fur family ferric uptake transcriptional regulator
MQVKKRKAASARAPSAPSLKDLQGLLRDAGLRSTAPRLAVLEYFHANGGQNSHAELFLALEGRGFDRATIYRNLMDLAEAEILSRTDLGDHVWRFELKRGAGGIVHAGEHPHFVCVDCGGVSCLPELAIRLFGRAPRSVMKKQFEIQLKGLCDECG